MKKLIIVGAGGFGREVYNYALSVREQQQGWEIAGFLDDNPGALDGYHYGLPIVGSIRDYVPRENDLFAMAIGTPTQQKLAIAESLTARGAEFVTLIHPYAGRSLNATIGKGCVIAPWAGISCDTRIGDFVTINAYASLGHDAIVDDGCTISSYASISGYAKLGKGVLVGIHGCVLPGGVIGDYATVGSGSVVVKNVKPHITVMGVPARKL